MKAALAAMFRSKKALALMGGLAATLLQLPLIKWLDMPSEAAVELATTISTQVVGLVAAYVVGQGVADHGKEAAKLQLAANSLV